MNKLILTLDLSTSTGYCLMDSTGVLCAHGLIQHKLVNFNVNDYPNKQKEYPRNLYNASELMAEDVSSLIHAYTPDIIVIENTVRGKNRNTQRVLEWINKACYDKVVEHNIVCRYLDPSEWRKIIGLKLSPEDKEHNKRVKNKLAKGKITSKHLSVRMVNEKFNMSLKLKDNDIADAICLGMATTKLINSKGE